MDWMCKIREFPLRRPCRRLCHPLRPRMFKTTRTVSSTGSLERLMALRDASIPWNLEGRGDLVNCNLCSQFTASREHRGATCLQRRRLRCGCGIGIQTPANRLRIALGTVKSGIPWAKYVPMAPGPRRSSRRGAGSGILAVGHARWAQLTLRGFEPRRLDHDGRFPSFGPGTGGGE